MIKLRVVKSSDSIYQDFRNRHYIPNSGTFGMQIHCLILDDNNSIGIISGASSVYSVKQRDLFFNIPQDKETRQYYYLPAIINNNVFRLENHIKNYGTMILKLWRNTITELWEYVYDIKVIGFETFIIESDCRKGSMYKADNWTYVGETFGSTKTHSGLINKHTRLTTDKKLIFCRNIKNKLVVPKIKYVSSWRNITEEDKQRNKLIQSRKLEILGKEFM